MSRGLTLIEMMMGLAIFAVVALVSTALFKAGVKTSQYTLNQTNALYNARKSLVGDGKRLGMAWGAQNGSSVSVLVSTSLSVNQPSASAFQYVQSGTDLLTTQSGSQTTLASYLNSMSVNYYNLDATGKIMVSTSAAAAQLVTTLLTFKTTSGRTYSFYSGGRLRNAP